MQKRTVSKRHAVHDQEWQIIAGQGKRAHDEAEKIDRADIIAEGQQIGALFFREFSGLA